MKLTIACTKKRKLVAFENCWQVRVKLILSKHEREHSDKKQETKHPKLEAAQRQKEARENLIKDKHVESQN